MRHQNWRCIKCGHEDFDADQFRATGGMFTKLFNIQNKRFSTVSCQRCGYTEIYRMGSSTLGNVLDFFTN